jgi:hypothetical protein
VPKDDEAWFFYGPDLVKCYFSDGIGKFMSQSLQVSPDDTLADLLKSLDVPDDAREGGLQPLNARPDNHERRLHFPPRLYRHHFRGAGGC